MSNRLRSVVWCLVLVACKDATPKRTVESKAAPARVSAEAGWPRLAQLTPAAYLHSNLADRADAAQREAERLGTPESWDAAGDELARLLAACTGDCRDLAFTLWKARQNALRLEPRPNKADNETPHDPDAPRFPLEPAPLPSRVQA
ncbi:MAG: hypothetical protein AB7L28_21885, partial [Kofleriaceae bacterium]